MADYVIDPHNWSPDAPTVSVSITETTILVEHAEALLHFVALIEGASRPVKGAAWLTGNHFNILSVGFNDDPEWATIDLASATNAVLEALLDTHREDLDRLQSATRACPIPPVEPDERPISVFDQPNNAVSISIWRESHVLNRAEAESLADLLTFVLTKRGKEAG